MDLRISCTHSVHPTSQSHMAYRWGSCMIINAVSVITSEGLIYQTAGITEKQRLCYPARQTCRDMGSIGTSERVLDLEDGFKDKYCCLMFCVSGGGGSLSNYMRTNSGNIASTSHDFGNINFLLKLPCA